VSKLATRFTGASSIQQFSIIIAERSLQFTKHAVFLINNLSRFLYRSKIASVSKGCKVLNPINLLKFQDFDKVSKAQCTAAPKQIIVTESLFQKSRFS
jgi:hypothetical protein